MTYFQLKDYFIEYRKLVRVQTDLVDDDNINDLTTVWDKKWPYINRALVTIFYSVRGDKDELSFVRLDNLFNRGLKRLYKFYRRKDLVELLHNDYGQIKCNHYMNDQTNQKYVSEELFMDYLRRIDENIDKKKKQYHHLFQFYSGPQCYEDFIDYPDKLTYDEIKLIVIASGNSKAIDKLNNITIEADELKYNQKDLIYTAKKNVKVDFITP